MNSSDAVYHALRKMGWIIPQTERQVAEVEKLGVQASACCKEQPKGWTPNSAPNEVGTTLARAAREAGRLTPEIEAAMRRDRQAAEEADGKQRGDRD